MFHVELRNRKKKDEVFDLRKQDFRWGSKANHKAVQNEA